MTEGPVVDHDLTSLDVRLGLLLMVRVALVMGAMAAAVYWPSALRVGPRAVATVGAGYLVLAGAGECYRRTALPGQRWLAEAAVAVDAAFLASLTTASGGGGSPVLVLFWIQLIAVTLLHSMSAGLRAALWDGLLVVLTAATGLGAAVDRYLSARAPLEPTRRGTAAAVVGFVAVAGFTAAFSTVSERELRRGKSQFAALAALAAAVESTEDEEQILTALLETATTAFGFRRAAVVYRGFALRLAPQAGPLAKVTVAGGADESAKAAWAQRRPQLLRHLDPARDPFANQLLPNACNVVIVPLLIDGAGTSVAVFEAGRRRGSGVVRRTLTAVEQLASHTVLALRNARLLAERERMASMDGLTGLANRREFDRVLTREINRSGRSKNPLTLVVLDVDHFKAINDTRGHLGGDEVLRSIASVLATSVRDMDVVARYGGEEFAVVLPGCDQHEAIRVVERIIERVRTDPSLPGVTVSAGLATIPFNAGDGRSLIAAADEAMYRSKRAGRDRYSVSGRHPDAPPAASAWC